MFLSQAVLPAMRTRRSGIIINISSVAGLDAAPSCALYAASKFALEGWTEAMAKEVEEFGISVLLVEPGAFRTNFLAAMNVSENAVAAASNEDDPYKNNISMQALAKFQAHDGKQIGDPDKAADRIIEYVTGQGEGGALKGRVVRMVLGKDAYLRIEAKTQKLHEDMALGRDVAMSTDIA
jgi:short-subunit dehydrogenase